MCYCRKRWKQCVYQRGGVGGVEHLYVQDWVGQAAQSIVSLSGPPVSGPCVALRIFATPRRFMDPARTLYTKDQWPGSWCISCPLWPSAVSLTMLRVCPCTTGLLSLPNRMWTLCVSALLLKLLLQIWLHWAIGHPMSFACAPSLETRVALRTPSLIFSLCLCSPWLPVGVWTAVT